MTDFAAARTMMVDTQIRPSDVTRYPIIDAMLRTPREEYLPAEAKAVAYVGDHVDIGEGRVALDPRVLAKMLDALDVQPDELVLDIGAGLGYSTAILGSLAEAVVGVEEVETFASRASDTLNGQGVDNATIEVRALAEGAAEHGPYDVIILQGAAEALPDGIADQLREDGRIAMIRAEGALGYCAIGVKGRNGISWRRSFDATAPVLPGFTPEKGFVF
ncbi:MAG: rRNA adenine N-6-methyltransferase family protein [Pseudomonadota bacterium]